MNKQEMCDLFKDAVRSCNQKGLPANFLNMMAAKSNLRHLNCRQMDLVYDQLAKAGEIVTDVDGKNVTFRLTIPELPEMQNEEEDPYEEVQGGTYEPPAGRVCSKRLFLNLIKPHIEETHVNFLLVTWKHKYFFILCFSPG